MSSATYNSGAITTGGYISFVKNRYPQRVVENLVAFGKPFLSEVKKVDDLYGNVTYIPIETSHGQGISAALSTAATNATASLGYQWAITRAKGYGVLTIDGETMLAMDRDDGAWFKARERETNNMFEDLGQQFEMQMWRDGTGSIGQLSADPGTGTSYSLKVAADALNLHVNMEVDFYDDSSGAPTGSARAGGTYTITGVDYVAGTFTADAANAAIEVDDHIVRAGNINLMIKGVPAWIGSTSTLFGVVRTAEPQKLGGFTQSWLGSIEETVKKLDANIRRVSQRPKTLWLSYANFNRLDLELGARGMRVEDGGQGVFGRSALMMSSPGGGVLVKAGPYVPETSGFLLDMSTWELHHRAGLPHLVEDDGNTALRQAAATADGIEIRYRWLAQLVCTMPFANGKLTIS